MNTEISIPTRETEEKRRKNGASLKKCRPLTGFQYEGDELPSPETNNPPQSKEIAPVREFLPISRKLQTWDLSDVEEYFQTAALPSGPVQLYPGVTITNVPAFLEGHFATVKANNGNPTFLPYRDRLQDLKTFLQA